MEYLEHKETNLFITKPSFHSPWFADIQRKGNEKEKRARVEMRR